MWLDLLALALLSGFALAGLLRGGLATGMSVATLVVAYGVAFGCASACGPGAAARLGVSDWLGPPLVGAGAFLVVFLAMGVLGAVLKRREQRRREGPRSPRDRLLGACFGLARGGLVVLLLCVLAIWLDALRSSGRADFLPAIGQSRAAALTGDVVEAGVEAAFADSGPGGRLVARVAARPASSLADLKGVLENPRIATLQRDGLFWTYVETGAVDAALDRSSFVDLLRDPQLLDGFASLGVIEPEVAADPSAFRALAGEALREIGPRIRGLREDPELQRLMADPAVVSAVESGNSFALLAHSGVRSFVSRVASR
jgi:hypothetical protein